MAGVLIRFSLLKLKNLNKNGVEKPPGTFLV